ncbi:MAG: nucleotide exchange factor GrpE [Bacteroidota bacterium]|nr:nucleotide exchange factor GrpE [Candidatus Kapabacteria bacterium]MCX7937043.1 nucleotide exchange factor GrpE [Chlorobiota bacterium]MDW8075514.1 nucleotide exchange factor GrpE [Bacteroidota bacterium]
MDEKKPFHKRIQEAVNAYIKQEQPMQQEKSSLPVQEQPGGSTADTGEVPPSVHPSSTELDTSAMEKRIAELEEQLQKLTQERDELRDKYIRTVAELDNFRKRTEREKEQLVLSATERLFARLVELLDDLHAAVEAGKNSRDYDAMLSGLEMIAAKAHKLYEEHGVRPLEVKVGEPFDVSLHEALVHMPHPEIPEGAIVQQVQRGYLFHDRVLRHARVITSAGTTGSNSAPSSEPQQPMQQSAS